MGIVCPTGNSVAEAWGNAAAGKSGIAPFTLFDTTGMDNQFGGEVKNFDPEALFGRREARRMDRFAQLAVFAAQQAVADSGLVIDDSNRYDVGAVIGSGIGGLSTIYNSARVFFEKGHRAVSPLMIPMMLPDSASGKISMMFGIRGPNLALSTACATGNNSIGEAAEMIRRGQIVAALAGSSESAMEGIAVAAFNNMTAISRRKDSPTKCSRPFDVDRDGFIVSEGAAILVLEELGHALNRGAHIYAEILGYGHTSDAYHVTAPLETGESASEAMVHALKDADLKPEAIDYINAHGTSTPLNDKSETQAIKRAFGETAYNIPISSTKSVTGHIMGGAGSVEAVFSIMAMKESFIPPTINLDNQDPACDLNYTPHVGVQKELNIVMSNSFGFGGHNAVLILGKYHANGRA
jgi:3-oxoacyl-[acyl-carrier-protein] synthase II